MKTNKANQTSAIDIWYRSIITTGEAKPLKSVTVEKLVARKDKPCRVLQVREQSSPFDAIASSIFD
jgi:hypothetical protein